MNKKKKAIIYPYDIESAPLLRHSELLDYEIIGVISLAGWIPDASDASCVDKGEKTGITVTYTENEELFNHAEAVLFIQPALTIDFNKFIYPLLLKAINSRKEIICTFRLEQNLYQEIADLCNEKKTDFRYYAPYGPDEYVKKNGDVIIRVHNRELKKINVPVIFVLGLAERVYKFELQLILRKYFLNKSYKVTQIGTRHYSGLCGFHPLPDFMFMRQYTETEKIFRLNEYISHLTELESPDLVIMGICGGVMPINEAIHNNFGILAHEVCASLKPDAVIVSTLFEDYPLEYFTELSNLFKYRFSLEPDCINLSNTMLDWGYLNELKRTKYLIKNQEAITKQLEKYKEMQTPVYNILDSRDSLRIGKFLEDKLISYSEVINA